MYVATSLLLIETSDRSFRISRIFLILMKNDARNICIPRHTIVGYRKSKYSYPRKVYYLPYYPYCCEGATTSPRNNKSYSSPETLIFHENPSIHPARNLTREEKITRNRRVDGENFRRSARSGR